MPASLVTPQDRPFDPSLERPRGVAVVERHSRKLMVGIDAALLVATMLVTQRLGGAEPFPRGALLLFGGTVLVLLAARGLYRKRLRLTVLDEARDVVTTTAIAAMATISSLALVADAQIARQIAPAWALATVSLVLTRVGFASLRRHMRRALDYRPPTLIVGAGRVGRLVARRLIDRRDVDLRPIGYLDDDPLRVREEPEYSLPVLGGSRDLEQVITEHGVEHVLLAFSGLRHETLLDIAARCEVLGVRVSYVPRLFERMKERADVQYLGGVPLISAEATDPKAWKFAAKHVFDRVFSALLLMLALPLLGAVAAAVWLSLGRPILYRQVRMGRDGRPFEMLKFRSMHPTPERLAVVDLPPDTAPGGVEGQDRRTRVGRIIRRLSLDELPQLINVLRGEMSLVGPRPERPEFAESFALDVHRYGERHRVRAGITGWAQVHDLRGNTSLADRVEWDNYYIDNWSFWLDVKILMLTGLAVFRAIRE